MKEVDKTPKEEISQVETCNLPNKQLKVMIIKMLNDLRRRMDKHSEKIKKELENIRKTKLN